MRTGRPARAVRDRLLERIEIDSATGCWLWAGVVNLTGYGQIQIPQGGGKPTKPRAVHRVAYETFIGPIPEGMTIDHVHARGCRSRRCINPAHLEAVTQTENNRRSPRLQKATCAAGHRYDSRDSRGYRRCSRCHRAAVRRWRAANKEHRAAYARDYRRRQKAAAA